MMRCLVTFFSLSFLVVFNGMDEMKAGFFFAKIVVEDFFFLSFVFPFEQFCQGLRIIVFDMFCQISEDEIMLESFCFNQRTKSPPKIEFLIFFSKIMYFNVPVSCQRTQMAHFY